MVERTIAAGTRYLIMVAAPGFSRLEIVSCRTAACAVNYFTAEGVFLESPEAEAIRRVGSHDGDPRGLQRSGGLRPWPPIPLASGRGDCDFRYVIASSGPDSQFLTV